MPEFKVFNPNNDSGVRTTSYVNALPESLQSDVIAACDAFKSVNGKHSMPSPGTMRLADLEDTIDVAAVLDRWAARESFDPRRAAVAEAAWVIAGGGGVAGVATSKMEDDPRSPCGKAWRVEVSMYNLHSDGWCGWAEGSTFRHWDLKSAEEAFGHARGREVLFGGHDESGAAFFAWDFDEGAMCVRVDPADAAAFKSSCEGLSPEDAAIRAEEFAAAYEPPDWAARDKPVFPNLFGKMEEPGSRAADGIWAAAGPYDISVALDDASGRAIGGIVEGLGEGSIEGVHVATAVDEAHPDAFSAQLDVYSKLYDAARSEFRGVENPADPSKPFPDVATAYSAFRSGAGPSSPPSAMRHDIPAQRGNACRAKLKVDDDMRAAQESARAQTKSGPDLIRQPTRASR